MFIKIVHSSLVGFPKAEAVLRDQCMSMPAILAWTKVSEVSSRLTAVVIALLFVLSQLISLIMLAGSMLCTCSLVTQNSC